MTNLTDDQKRLLILISYFSKPAKKRDEEETWIKKIPLQSLITRGITLGIFKEYDSAAQLVDYMGSVRFAKISKEGEDDIADLRTEGLIERLKLATSHHVYVSAYKITHLGIQTVSKLEQKHKDAVDKIIRCGKCKDSADIQSKEDSPYLICKKCKVKEKVDIFDIDEVSYESKPIFSKIWLPPDTTE